MERAHSAEAEQLRDWSQPVAWEAFGPAQPNPPMQILDMLKGFMVSQLLYVAVDLGIADKLAAGAKTTGELAAECEAVPERIERLMPALIAHGLFALDPSDSNRFINNTLSSTLRHDHPNCMRAAIAHWIEDCWDAWRYLPEAIKDGEHVYRSKRVYEGKDIWAQFNAHPRQAEQFSRAMTCWDSLGAWAMALDGPFAKATRVVDVGGSRGHSLAKILRTYPHLVGVVFDLPPVISDASQHAWTGEGEYADLVGRVELLSGSFMDVASVPQARDGDAYVMKFILHDWNDENSIRILSNLRAAMSHATDVRLLICEIVLPDRNVAIDPMSLKYILDLHMCVVLDGKERSVSEWDALIEAGGFTRVATHATRSMMSIIEVVPKPLK